LCCDSETGDFRAGFIWHLVFDLMNIFLYNKEEKGLQLNNILCIYILNHVYIIVFLKFVKIQVSVKGPN